MQAWLFTTGIEHQPGPEVATVHHEDLIAFDGSHKTAIVLETSNITCLETHMDELVNSNADFTFFQEASALPAVIATTKSKFLNNTNKVIDVGCLDPTTKHNVGGVGACAYKKPHRLIPMESRTKVFAEAVLNGRVMHYGIGTVGGKVISVFNIYGYSGGAKCKPRAAKTNALLDAIYAEITEMPRGPIAIVGDYNGDPDSFRTLQLLLNKEGWTDYGAVAERWNQPNCMHTCVTSNCKTPTRRDYICGNQEFTNMVKNFRVCHDNNLPTHSTIQIVLDLGEFTTERRQLQAPSSIANLLRGKILKPDDDGEFQTKEQRDEWQALLMKFRELFDKRLTTHKEDFANFCRQQNTTDMARL